MARSVIIAAIFAIGAAAWILSGQFGDRDQPAQAETKGEAETTRTGGTAIAVRVRNVEPRELRRNTVINGRTEASRIVELRAEIDGRIVAVPAREGEIVEKGTVVAEIATEDRKAKLAHAQALLEQRELEYEAARRLSQKGFRANTKLAESKAYLDEARAQIARMRIELGQTVVKAPFDGMLDERMVEIGALTRLGDGIARIVDLDPILVVGHATERDVSSIAAGAEGSAVLADGRRVSGHVRYVASVADPKTRTFKVELEVANPDHAVRAGLTSQLILPRTPVRAHKISPALLALNDEGVIGVKIVDDQDTARFVPVQILSDEIDGIWIGGLSERARLITVGHEYVKSGQKVRPVEDAAAPAS